MTLKEIRIILLQQHASLREKIEDARGAAKLWRVGDWSRDDLQERLALLADQLRAHNACEEGLLINVLPAIDAWGQARYDLMATVHLEEHRNLCGGLIDASISAGAKNGSFGILLLLDAVLEHMKEEEESFLAFDLLTDDVQIGDAFGG